MARAHNINVTNAHAARRRQGQERKAEELRAAKWTCTPPVDLAELTRRMGLPEDEQSAVAAWTGDPYGTVWTEAEADQLVMTWNGHRER